MNFTKKTYATLLHILFFLYFTNYSDCLSKKILISNKNNENDSFNQTFDDFYENLSEAFQNTTEKYSNSTSEDIFIFVLFPTEQSYIIDDDQFINKSGEIFRNFKGNRNYNFCFYSH